MTGGQGPGQPGHGNQNQCRKQICCQSEGLQGHRPRLNISLCFPPNRLNVNKLETWRLKTPTTIFLIPQGRFLGGDFGTKGKKILFGARIKNQPTGRVLFQMLAKWIYDGRYNTFEIRNRRNSVHPTNSEVLKSVIVRVGGSRGTKSEKGKKQICTDAKTKLDEGKNVILNFP